MTLRLRADRQLRTRSDGCVLIGGDPTTLLRISKPAAGLLESWFAGEPVGDDQAERALARRLLANGMAHPEIEAAAEPPVVVIPVRHDPEGLAVTIETLNLGHDQVIVVHDEAPRPMGPAQARNRGLDQIAAAGHDASIVAFVDAGVRISGEALGLLTTHFADPDVVAVAPRVASVPGPGLVARYDQQNSPLDLGPDPGVVGVGRRISYVPTACLLVRASAWSDVRFDPSLRYGEDVDLLWRLEAAGGVIRYDPSVVAHHQPRRTVAAMVKQRFGYGSAAGPLAERHGQAVAPLRLNARSVGVAILVGLGRPVLAATLVALSAEQMRRRLPAELPDRRIEAFRLSMIGHWAALGHTGEYFWRAGWPAAVAFRPLLIIGWLRGPSRRIIDVMLGPIDDLAYGSGVLWSSAKRLRTRWPAVVPMIKRLN